MEHSNYVILIDESGQPYIAHSVWSKAKSAVSSVGSRAKSAAKSAGEGMGRGYRESVKYILKVGEGAKAQYAYTKEEAERLLGRGRQKVQQTVDTAKQKATSAYNTGRQALSTGKEKVSATYNKAIKNVSSTATKVPEYLKDTVAIRDKATGAIVRGQEAVKKIESGAKAAASKAKDKAADTLDSVARNTIPGYVERQKWQDDEKKAAEAKRKHDEMASEYAKAINTAVDTSKTRDTSAAASKARDDAIDTIRRLTGDDDKLLQAQKDEWAANEATWISGRAYAKTPLGKVEEFMKDPLFNTKLAVEGVVWDAQDKVRDFQQKMADRRQEKATAKAEAAMKKDPKVMKAREELSTYQTDYNVAENRFMDYVTSSRAEKGSDEWKRLERAYDRAKDDLEYAQRELDRYEKPYRK